MKKIKFVVDSTFGVSNDYLIKHGIKVNPLSVIIDDDVYLDGITIQLPAVMAAVEAGKKVTTSQPNPITYLKLYDELFSEGADQIICLTLSKTFSGTIQSATLAKNEHARSNDIFVLDTDTTHIGAILLLESAIEAAQKGKTAPEIIEIINKNKVGSTILLSLKSLDVLFRAGRISKIKTILGNLLHVKPVVRFFKTKVEVIKKVRTDQKVYDYFMHYIKQQPYHGKLKMRISHINAIERANILLEQVKKNFPKAEVSIGEELNPVLAIHIANGGIGLAWIYDNDN